MKKNELRQEKKFVDEKEHNDFLENNNSIQQSNEKHPVFQEINELSLNEKTSSTTKPNNKLIGMYAREIKKFALLTADEERTLAQKVQKGDQAAKRKMIESNLRLVVRVARRYKNYSLDFLDLVEEGNLGLIRAIEKYNPDFNFRLSTYATIWIRQSIERSLMNSSRTIRFPVHILKRLNSFYKIYKGLVDDLGRSPTQQELMKSSGLSLEQILKIQSQNEQVKNTNLMYDDDFDFKSSQQINRQTSSNPRVLLQTQELRTRLEKELTELEPRYQEVLSRRFGLLGYQPETLEQVGKAISLTRERVRQLQLEALKVLHQRLRKEEITFEDLVPLELEEVQ